jgi:hypothetical protein
MAPCLLPNNHSVWWTATNGAEYVSQPSTYPAHCVRRCHRWDVPFLLNLHALQRIRMRWQCMASQRTSEFASEEAHDGRRQRVQTIVGRLHILKHTSLLPQAVGSGMAQSRIVWSYAHPIKIARYNVTNAHTQTQDIVQTSHTETAKNPSPQGEVPHCASWPRG